MCMMNNKQRHNAKELLCFYVNNHDGGNIIMRNYPLIVFVLVLSMNLGVQGVLQNVTARMSSAESTNSSLLNNISNDRNQTISILTVYNANRNKILLNISWYKPLDWTQIHSYYFKLSSNGNNRSNCNQQSFENIKTDKTLTNILLPPLIDKYEILPGCTYQVSIIRNYVDMTNNKTDILYTIPECVDKKCSCTNLTPQFKRFEAQEISPGKLNISWELGNKETSVNEKVYNITHRIFEYRAITAKDRHNNPFIKLKPEIKHNYFTLDNTGIFTIDQFYQLRASFNNSYNCKIYIYTNFTFNNILHKFHDINNNPNTILVESTTFSTTVQKGGEVTNIKTGAIYNPSRNKIVLNVTWDKPLDLINSYNFKLSPYSNQSYCTHESFETINKDKSLTGIILPPILNKYEIIAGCTYNISIITNRFHLGKTTSNTVYTIPECVGKKCACRKLTPQFLQLDAVEVSSGVLNISWEIDKMVDNPNVYTITDTNFEYRPTLSEPLHNNPFRRLTNTWPIFQPASNYIILNETSALLPDKEYQLKAIFNNTYNCKSYQYTNFTMTHPKVEESSQHSSSIIHLVLSLTLSSLVVLGVIYFLRRNRLVVKEIILNPLSLRFSARRRRRRETATSYIMVPTITKRQLETNLLYVDKEIVDGHVDSYEFPRSRLSPQIRVIGGGAFGQVYLAKAFGIDKTPGYKFVAVKTLREKAPPEEMEDFLSEIEILKKVGEHPNIVRIFGCCILKEPYLMIMEFIPCGDLKHYLLDLRNTWRKKRSRNDSSPVFTDSSDGVYIVPNIQQPRVPSEDRPSVTETECTSLQSEDIGTPTEAYVDNIECNLDHTELQNFALQIAKGMQHLEKIPIAHRDLAARNILINEYKVLKISDFGLSRAGPYVNNRTKKMPLRWVSLEAIEDNFYDSKGDVWSFAVVLWEIGTLGAFPYESILDAMVPHYLISGKRLQRPEICTDELYSLMLRCWNRDPQLRPSFQELVELLDVKKQRVYVDFNQLNPLYVFPPSKVLEFDEQVKIPDGTCFNCDTSS